MNYTRFLVLSREAQVIENANKASLSFQTGNTVGALSTILHAFAEEQINLSKIQSMPVLGRRDEYEFYVDVEWSDPQRYDRAIRQVLKHTANFNIMGEYKKNNQINYPSPFITYFFVRLYFHNMSATIAPWYY